MAPRGGGDYTFRESPDAFDPGPRTPVEPPSAVRVRSCRRRGRRDRDRARARPRHEARRPGRLPRFRGRRGERRRARSGAARGGALVRPVHLLLPRALRQLAGFLEPDRVVGRPRARRGARRLDRRARAAGASGLGRRARGERRTRPGGHGDVGVGRRARPGPLVGRRARPLRLRPHEPSRHVRPAACLDPSGRPRAVPRRRRRRARGQVELRGRGSHLADGEGLALDPAAGLGSRRCPRPARQAGRRADARRHGAPAQRRARALRRRSDAVAGRRLRLRGDGRRAGPAHGSRARRLVLDRPRRGRWKHPQRRHAARRSGEGRAGAGAAAALPRRSRGSVRRRGGTPERPLRALLGGLAGVPRQGDPRQRGARPLPPARPVLGDRGAASRPRPHDRRADTDRRRDASALRRGGSRTSSRRSLSWPR